jgi:hypothetical protein
MQGVRPFDCKPGSKLTAKLLQSMGGEIQDLQKKEGDGMFIRRPQVQTAPEF